jgi:regulatory protein
VARVSSDRNAPPLDRAAIERLAVAYVGRYATTRAKLTAYLTRKTRERDWAQDGQTPAAAIEAVVARCAALGYVDDRAFAEARAGALTRRGYGARRVAEALRAAGIDEADAAPAREAADAQAWEAALAFARRRRIGPFASVEAAADPDRRRRAFAALMRAGHAPAIARRLCDAAPDDMPGNGT